MKNINIDNGHLTVDGNSKGSNIITFGIVFIICWMVTGFVYSKIMGVNLGLIFLVLGILCLIAGVVFYLFGRKKCYLEIKDNVMYVYTTGTSKQYYKISLNRISYLTHIHRQQSKNTECFVVVLNDNDQEAVWVNDSTLEPLRKNEIDLEYLPISNKKLPVFLNLLEENYNLVYKK